MKFRLFTAIAITAMAIVSCSEETAGIGKSLTDEDDKLQVSTGIFEAHSKSLVIDSIYAQNFDCFFGQIKDPETGTYVKTEFMTQFNLLEGVKFPSKELMVVEDGQVIADSCEIWLFFNKERCYGDSLVPLKMRLQELIEPMDDNLVYYSDYDPEEAGYIREGGIDKKQMFSIVNHTYSDEARSSKGYGDIIRITLNDPYIAPDGQSYNNYGSYLLQTYYDHPEYYKNSYTFVHKVCPGFNFKIEDGLGVMANINDISLRLYYHYKKSNDAFTNTMMAFAATPEILQTCHVTNDKEGLKELAADNSCTYLKTPSGIFTEVELPVMKIMEGHHNDSLLSVNMTFQRMNSELFENEYLLKAPSMVLMIQKDSLFSFFEKEKTYDYRSSFVSSLNKNTYSFTNMGNIVTLMFRDMFVGSLLDPDWEKKHPDWNKVVLVPVTTILSAAQKTNTAGAATATVNGICNNLALTSTKLVGGNTPIKVNVIYAKFNDKK
jgi:hypothetical protein